MDTSILTKSYLKDLVYKTNGAAIKVHKALGPGLLESVYQKCLVHELSLRGIKCESELNITVNYEGLLIDTELRCDIFVEGVLPVELKAKEKIKPINEAQILTYMKLLNVPLGLMINFNVLNIYDQGQKTYVNELYRNLPS